MNYHSKSRFALRKYSFGVASVLLGISISTVATSHEARAAEVSQSKSVEAVHQQGITQPAHEENQQAKTTATSNKENPQQEDTVTTSHDESQQQEVTQLFGKERQQEVMQSSHEEEQPTETAQQSREVGQEEGIGQSHEADQQEGMGQSHKEVQQQEAQQTSDESQKEAAQSARDMGQQEQSHTSHGEDVNTNDSETPQSDNKTAQTTAQNNDAQSQQQEQKQEVQGDNKTFEESAYNKQEHQPTQKETAAQDHEATQSNPTKQPNQSTNLTAQQEKSVKEDTISQDKATKDDASQEQTVTSQKASRDNTAQEQETVQGKTASRHQQQEEASQQRHTQSSSTQHNAEHATSSRAPQTSNAQTQAQHTSKEETSASEQLPKPQAKMEASQSLTQHTLQSDEQQALSETQSSSQSAATSQPRVALLAANATDRSSTPQDDSIPQLEQANSQATTSQRQSETPVKQSKAATQEAVQKDDVDTIQSNDMTVTLSKQFPSVLQYQLKDGQTFDGDKEQRQTVKINNIEVTPNVTYQKLSDSSAQYILDVKNQEQQIDATFTFELSVDNNTLDYKMTDYESRDPENIIKIFEIPNQSLVSVNSSQSGANLQTTKLSNNTMKSGDNNITIDQDFDDDYYDFMMYGFVSNNNASAGVWANSQFSTSVGEGDDLRLSAHGFKDGEHQGVGLGSSIFILQPSAEHQSAKEQGLMPEAKVVISEDENNDGKINWQDGAIGYRNIMQHIYGSEEIPDLVSNRIAMNFGSQAQNPFLKTLDDVKKVDLSTDGLGQAIILKGYGGEGHDSNHLDYDKINQRAGGIEDLNTLLELGKKYGARIGLHVNASETYPESKAFDPDLLLKNEDGSYVYGWNWLDQGFNINADYDLRHDRESRFEALKDITGDGLDFIYVDVWGNEQSGNNQAWASHQLARELNNLGWRVGVEWGHGMEYDGTFNHWAIDQAYGGYENKGINSEVARFIHNHEKDSWIANYPQYSGAADAPLLGGYNMKDFEGWQGRGDYDAYIENIFENNIPTKYLQHYLVNRIENGHPVTMTANNQTIEWTPEMLVELVNDQGDKVTVTRKSNDYENDKDNYRSRTITLNDRTILDGDKYLLPWLWDKDGQPVAQENEKLYHWNKDGGDSEWTLPSDWTTDTVYLYKLTDQGRVDERAIPVVDGKIQLTDIDKATGYVLYQTPQPQEDMVWSEGTPFVDSGFNSGSLEGWDIEGNKDQATITKSNGHNPMLTLSNDQEPLKLTQSLTGLTPGQQYALYLGIDNRSDQGTTISITDQQGNVLDQNTVHQSIAKNYVKADAHNTSKGNATVGNDSYFQNMYVFFTAPSDGQVNFNIQREASDDLTYIDDLRLVKYNGEPLEQDGTFKQDFEAVPQGVYPFVVSEGEGVEDNRIHLSEKNAPYTQRGFNHKRIDDVINGHWSLKINGLTGKDKMLIQTIPQNLQFEPGKKYQVTFDYESGSDDIYAFAIGHGPIEDKNYDVVPLKGTSKDDHSRQATFEVTGSEDGLTWIGIYSTKAQNDPLGVTDGGQINFEGTKDFVLDNLVVSEINDQDNSDTDQDDIEPGETDDNASGEAPDENTPTDNSGSEDNGEHVSTPGQGNDEGREDHDGLEPGNDVEPGDSDGKDGVEPGDSGDNTSGTEDKGDVESGNSGDNASEDKGDVAPGDSNNTSGEESGGAVNSGDVDDNESGSENKGDVEPDDSDNNTSGEESGGAVDSGDVDDNESGSENEGDVEPDENATGTEDTGVIEPDDSATGTDDEGTEEPGESDNNILETENEGDVEPDNSDDNASSIDQGEVIKLENLDNNTTSSLQSEINDSHMNDDLERDSNEAVTPAHHDDKQLSNHTYQGSQLSSEYHSGLNSENNYEPKNMMRHNIYESSNQQLDIANNHMNSAMSHNEAITSSTNNSSRHHRSTNNELPATGGEQSNAVQKLGIISFILGLFVLKSRRRKKEVK